MRFQLPDTDVFAIDANALTQTAAFAHVGTTLFNMATNPVTGKLYVSNTEAVNKVRFEGPGSVRRPHRAGPPRRDPHHRHRGRDSVTPRSTSTSTSTTPGSPVSRASIRPPRTTACRRRSTWRSPATAQTLYVAAFGSSKIGVFDTAALEDDSFDPRQTAPSYIPVSGGGPSGLALDEPRGRLYVMTRFDNAVKVIDLASKAEIAALALPNPEPASVVAGPADALRRHAVLRQRRGRVRQLPHLRRHGRPRVGPRQPRRRRQGQPDPDQPRRPGGDRSGQGDRQVPRADQRHRPEQRLPPDEGPDDDADPARPVELRRDALARRPVQRVLRGRRLRRQPVVRQLHRRVPGPDRQRRPAAGGARCRRSPTSSSRSMPPNPVRNLDNSLTASQAAGKSFFFGPRASDGLNVPILGGILTTFEGFTCNGCHELDPAEGEFGTSKHGSSKASSGRSSRSRTCATCTRRSACSAIRGSRPSMRPTAGTPATRSAASGSPTTARSTPCSGSSPRWCFIRCPPRASR